MGTLRFAERPEGDAQRIQQSRFQQNRGESETGNVPAEKRAEGRRPVSGQFATRRCRQYATAERNEAMKGQLSLARCRLPVVTRSLLLLLALAVTAVAQTKRPNILWISTEDISPRSEEHTSELQSLRHLVCR